MSVVVIVFGDLTFWLSAADDVDLRELDALQVMRRPSHGDEVEMNEIAEWLPERGRAFSEAPEWQSMVAAGQLPPVEERLPENPLVVIPVEQQGPYGGTWVRYGTGPSDVGIFSARLAYDGLVRWGPMGREIRPNLATHWEIGEGGRTYTFHLRRGVHWSDGHAYSADDILFWYEDVLLESDLTPVIDMDYRPGGELVQVVKLDSFTVRFRFDRPNGLFLKQLASNLSYTLVSYPKHYMKQFHKRYVLEEELKHKTREAGRDFWHQLFKDRHEWRNPEVPRIWAWVCKQPPPSRPAVFHRNPYYWKVDDNGQQLPYIDEITFDIYDIETINLKVINGEIGMQGRHLNTPDYPLFMANRESGGYQVRHWIDGGDGTGTLSPNLNHRDPVLRKLFSDRRFRIALSHALNRDAINEINFFGLGYPRQVAPPPESRYYVADYENAYLEYSPEKANALLDEMGLTAHNEEGIRLRSDGEPLVIHLETSSTQSAMNRLFEMAVADWTAVGVKAKLKTTARQLYRQRREALLCDVHVWGGAGEIIPVLDPRWFLPYSTSSFHGLDYARWYRTNGAKGEKPPPEMMRCIELFEKMRGTVVEQEQIRLFKEIIEINRQNLWVIGTVGGVPQIFVVKNTFRNVPETAVACWPLRTPGATAPECYAIEEEGEV
ncbi:MAG: ABC transporter substrate-binding protein [Candidatus Latescibacterota bacterium]|nr:ABC transporter substrate-binding protein [Candidatus Latescibacterota bacterium]